MSLLRNVHSTKELVMHASVDDVRELRATIDLIVRPADFEHGLLIATIVAAIHANPILVVRLGCLQDATKAKLGMVLKYNQLGIWDKDAEKFFEFPLPHEIVRSSAAEAAKAFERLCNAYVGMPAEHNAVHQEETHEGKSGQASNKAFRTDARSESLPDPRRASV